MKKCTKGVAEVMHGTFGFNFPANQFLGLPHLRYTLLAVVLFAGSLGCSVETEPLQLLLDVSNCFDHQTHKQDGLCDLALGDERFGGGLVGCLAWRAAQSNGVITYKYASDIDDNLKTVEGGPINVPAGTALRLKLFLLDPLSEKADCGEFTTNSRCLDEEHPNCLLSFREQVITNRPKHGHVQVTFGTQALPCGIQCNDSCEGEECTRSLCWRPQETYDEICDGRDNNCSGKINDLPGNGEPCQTNIAGPCSEGIVSCLNEDGGTELVCQRTNLDYDVVDGECHNQMDVPCIEPLDVPRDNVELQAETVTIHFTRENGWSEVDFCEWHCVEGFALEEGECINNKDVPCIVPADSPPPGMEPVRQDVTIHYVDVDSGEWQWTEPEECLFACADGHILEDDQCLNSKDVLCSTEDLPDNSVHHVILVTVEPEEVDGQLVWQQVLCGYHCTRGYASEAGMCLNQKEMPCVVPEPIPPGTELILGNVIVHYEPGASGDWRWSVPEKCLLLCLNEAGHLYDLEEGVCHDRKEVDCSHEGNPDHSFVIDALVIVQPELVGDDWVWSTPEACDWSCEDHYGRHEEQCLLLPTVDTSIAELLRPNGAKLAGAVIEAGQLPIIEWGFVVDGESRPDPGNTDPELNDVPYDFHYRENGELAQNVFDYIYPDEMPISPNTDVYFRAYARSEAGFAYGQERRFNIRTIDTHNPQSNGNGSTGSSISMSSYEVPSELGTQLMLVVFVTAETSTSSEATTCTFGGEDMLKAEGASALYSAAGNSIGAATFYLPLEEGQTGDISATFPSNSVNRGVILAVTLNNAEHDHPKEQIWHGSTDNTFHTSLSDLSSQLIVISGGGSGNGNLLTVSLKDHRFLAGQTAGSSVAGAIGYKHIEGPTSGDIGWSSDDNNRGLITLTAFAPWDDIE